MPPVQQQQQANPSSPQKWWQRAKELGLDPRQLDVTTHKSHSASKFTEEDFIHLKALWRNSRVDQLHISEHVRKEHVQALEFILVRANKASDGELAKHPLRQCLMEFIRTSSDPLTEDDAKNVRLGAFLLVKSNLEAIKGINNSGEVAAGDLPKIRRSARVMAKGQGDMAALSQQLGSMMIDAKAPGQPSTPPKPPRTPSPKAGAGSTPELLATRELAVISPESMALENTRSRDEDSVNAALVSLLDAITLCSGIKKTGGRQSLKWHHTRQAFSLGPAHNPVCEARTDGLLVLGGKPEYRLAILEVKPYKRTLNSQRIEWQEACQMAAWISSSLGEKTSQKRNEGFLHTGDPLKKRRVLISQDYEFLYITIAEWGRAYEDYLYGKARPPTPPSKSASPSQDRGRPAGTAVGEGQAAKPTAVQTVQAKKSSTTSAVKAAGAPAAAAAAGQAKKSSKPAAQGDKPIAKQSDKPPAQAQAPREVYVPTAEEVDAGNFLTMNCYGAYSVRDPSHMAMFVRNVLALMLELSDPL